MTIEQLANLSIALGETITELEHLYVAAHPAAGPARIDHNAIMELRNTLKAQNAIVRAAIYADHIPAGWTQNGLEL